MLDCELNAEKVERKGPGGSKAGNSQHREDELISISVNLS
jgi:hypothetical protein